MSKKHGRVNFLELCYLVYLLITSFHFFSRQVLANFSALSTTPPIRIQKTELRGITIDQLLVVSLSLWSFWSNFAFETITKRELPGKPTLAKSRHLRLAALVDFVKDRVSHWCEAHEESPNYGNFLDFDTFNLYQANFWVIEPATRDHGRKGCSYVELVAISMDDQRPKWFVSHAWLEPIVRFMLCLKQHALLRQLSLQSAYWVCASTWSNLPEKFCFTLVLVLVAAYFWDATFFLTYWVYVQPASWTCFFQVHP